MRDGVPRVRSPLSWVEDEGSQSQASIFSGFLTFLGSICLLEDSSMHGIVREVSDQRSQLDHQPSSIEKFNLVSSLPTTFV